MSSQQSFIHDTQGDCSARQSLYVPNAKQWLLEQCTTAAADAAGEDRESEEQMGPAAKRQRIDNAQPDSSSVLDACLNQFLALADK